jgi:menaquinol-cytochrome c reductase iron-sulfur subunit
VKGIANVGAIGCRTTGCGLGREPVATGERVTEHGSEKEQVGEFAGPAGDPPVARRRFLRWLSGVGASLSAVVVGFPVLRAFVSPALPAAPTDSWIKVADDVALIDTDIPIRVNFVETKVDAWLEDRQLNGVWLYTEDGKKFKAYNAHCTHLGCAFSYDETQKIFACPCHHGEFDVKTGRVLAGPPPRPLDELKVEVRDDAVWVNYKDFRLGISDQIET